MLTFPDAWHHRRKTIIELSWKLPMAVNFFVVKPSNRMLPLNKVSDFTSHSRLSNDAAR